MTESLEDDLRAMRSGDPKKMRLWLAIGLGNLLVFGLLVVGPYARGRMRAAHARTAFAGYAACLLGGRAERSPGLALPEGALQRYGVEFRRENTWPVGCMPLLDAVAVPYAFWIFPETRSAEEDVRRAVSMVHEELQACIRPPLPAQAPVPERPWLATQRLMAALTVQLDSAGEGQGLLESAVFLDQRRTPIPLRIPIRAAEQATLSLVLREGQIQLVALDRRGVSWVQIGAGGVTSERMRRPALLQDVLMGPAPALVWATPASRCFEHSCQHQTTGVGWLSAQTHSLPQPVYYGAHPAGDPRLVIRPMGTDLWIAAQREGGAEMVRFSVRGALQTVEADGEVEPPEPRGSLPAAAPVKGPDESFGVVAGDTFLLHRTNGNPPMQLIHITDGQVRAGQETLWRGPAQWVLEAGSGLFAGGAQTTVYLHGGQVISLDAPVDLRDCQVAVSATHGLVAIAGQTPQGVFAARCLGGFCQSHRIAGADAQELAPDEPAKPALFDLVVFGDQVFVAFVRSGQVSVGALTADGRLELSPVPADCLSETGGFCGAPTLAADASRLVLGVRDGTDLLLVESVDGRRWVAGDLGDRP